MTRPPPLSPGLAAVFAPHRTPLPLPPFVVSRVMARAAAAVELTAHRRRRVRFSSWWVFAAASGAVLMLGAGAYAARAWIRAPSSGATAAPAPSPWRQPSRAARSVTAVVQPPGPAPEASARRRASATHGKAGAAGTTTSVELELLRTARQDVTRGDYAGALVVIGQHRRRFENGTLVEEREALRVKALAGLGRHKEALVAAAAFRARFPHSVFLSTFERLRDGTR